MNYDPQVGTTMDDGEWDDWFIVRLRVRRCNLWHRDDGELTGLNDGASVAHFMPDRIDLMGIWREQP